MALQVTNLTAAITASQVLNIPVASTTGATVGLPCKIDGEFVGAVVSLTTSSMNVRIRGDQGTPAVAHDKLAVVEFQTTGSDWPQVPVAWTNQFLPSKPLVISYGSTSGVIAAPVSERDVTAIITSSTIAAALGLT